MPTPVSTARQCLTDEAARVLDDAVGVARRRSHAQTTSLHAVSALLALPSSALREACARARSCAYSPRLQFRALELSVGVSLDRLPTAKALDEPPISNSLMAAVKRSQANQRRHPDTFHLYQQLQHQGSASSSISTLKVELKHFVLSILDDPIVSRVFGEAGFRSYDIKLAILNPPTLSRLSSPRYPPLFFCNLPDSEFNRRPFNFPFSRLPGNENVDENSRRIGEVLARKTSKNPLLIGACANDALNSFTDCVQKGKDGVFPHEINGLRVISIGKDILEFFRQPESEKIMGLKIKEVSDAVESCKGSGVVVNYGELKVFVDGEAVEAVKYVVSELSRLVEVHRGKLWLVGAAASDDVYMKFLARFPSVQKDWDLHLLPITSTSPPGGLNPRSSLMGSFVPFAGFFPTPSEFENLQSSRSQSPARCNLCNEKYEQEVSTLLKGLATSVADQHPANVSPWLQMAESGPSNRLVGIEAKDDNAVFNVKVVGLQKKWNEICHRVHHHAQSFQPDVLHARFHVSGVDTFHSPPPARSESKSKDLVLDESRLSDQNPGTPLSLQNLSPSSKQVLSKSVIREDGSDLQQVEPPAKDLKLQQPKTGNIWNPGASHLPLDSTSSSLTTSVSTDLGLGTIYVSTEKKLPEPSFQQHHKDRLQYFSGSVSSDKTSEHASNYITQSSCSFVPRVGDMKDFKYLHKSISEIVYWQDEAIYAISHTVSCCRNGQGRGHGPNKGNIWLTFGGPDKVGKRKVSRMLAEKVFGSKDSLLFVDLNSNNQIHPANSFFDRHDLKSRYVNFRGKTVVDYIADELSKKRHSVVLLENIEKADFLVQNSLSQSLKTGKFPDLHGREISINNMMFVITTSNVPKAQNDCLSGKDSPMFSEESVLAARDSQMQIIVGSRTRDGTRIENTNVFITSRNRTLTPFSLNKRKLTDTNREACQSSKRAFTTSKVCLDLNLPVEEMMEEENNDSDNSNSESGSGSEGSKAWLDDFKEQMDGNVTFKPFDFDTIAKKILNQINHRLLETVGSTTTLEIDLDIMTQILAAAWLSDRKEGVEDWIQEVLCRSFIEAQKRFHLTPSSSDKAIKLVPCEGIPGEAHHACGIHLPGRICVN
ncbi:PREDICTED: protein SMAX1-LIKE 6-like [Ipomoea nil]|uniref:protein SMAX1-LIKE 6-like n=1 Tax=Ipomoea nil TaxID=35883 RepID=UPI0009015D0D|nr:PREDICTED: protein SMAX1-LIKE 6-like [Ipomoea nil]